MLHNRTSLCTSAFYDNPIYVSEEAFEYVLQEKNTTGLSRAEIIEQLKKRQILDVPVEIVGERRPFKVTRAKIRRLHKKYEGFSIQKKYGIKLHYRGAFYPTSKGES